MSDQSLLSQLQASVHATATGGVFVDRAKLPTERELIAVHVQLARLVSKCNKRTLRVVK